MTETDQPGFAQGWYRAPNDPDTERYYDGSKWTDSYRGAPQAMAPSPVASGEKEQKATGVIIFGYITAVLIPFVGFIIGLTQINKNRHGIWVVALSVVVFAIGFYAISAAQNGGGGGGGGLNY